MNPIFVREIRQAVRNRLLLVLLCGYLVVLLLTIFYELVWEAQFMQDETGRKLFNSLAIVVGPGTLAVVLAHTILRCAADRVNEDSLFFALITPGQIVRGRMYCSLLLSCIAYSVVLPFLTLAYMLRGLDINLVLLSCLAGLWWTQVLNLIAIAFFIGVRSWLGAVLQAVPYLIVTLFFGAIALSTWWWVISEREWGMLPVFAVVFGLFLPSIAYTLARAQMIPPSGERMFAFRLNLSIWIPLLGIAAAIFHLLFPDGFFPIVPIFFCVIGMVLFPVLGLIILCERDEYPLRQRQGIPRNPVLRFLYFPLSSGVVNGLLWLLLLGAVWAVGLWCLVHMEHNHATDAELFPLVTFLLFVFDYAATTRLVREYLFKRFPLPLLWILAVGAVVTVAVFTVLLNATNRAGPDIVPIPLSPFPMADGGEYHSLQIGSAWIWAAGLILTGIPTFRRRNAMFQRPPEPEPASEPMPRD